MLAAIGSERHETAFEPKLACHTSEDTGRQLHLCSTRIGQITSMTVYNPAVEVPSKEALLAAFKGKRVSEIQTPNLIIDRATFIANCKRMKRSVEQLGWDFRAHVKTHKTAEGALLQCQHTGTSKLCASTLPEMYVLRLRLNRLS